MTNHIMDVMTSFPLFESLSRVQLARLIPHLEMKQFSRSEVICHQNDKADALYLITEGSAQLVHNNEQGHSMVMGQLIHHTYYGASEILDQTTYMNSLVASEDIAIIQLSRSGLFRLLKYDPSLALHILKNQQDIFEKCCNILTRVH
ncbi:MAG: cyclic nucleotide-binding domain-containing protein, partial [Thermodesulfobacteriota bacterium]|nr:cyclic nucleotide-binding domain-containing protein [Thermodesulfobacteriota bacterium]